jgi:hypothetical protein
MFCSGTINRKYKVIIYKTVIKPVLMSGAETWVLCKADDLGLAVFERKILILINNTAVVYSIYYGAPEAKLNVLQWYNK